jgi:hypothetical protein
MREIDCAHSRTLKTLPLPWFRKGIGVLKRKSNIFGFLWENCRFLDFSRREIDCTHSRTVKTPPWPWFREGIGDWKRKSIYLRKESYINVVRFDFYYKQMCSRVLYLFYFSLNQGQGSVFMIRECAQSIPRLEKPKNRRFSHKNPIMFDFRFNTPMHPLNQGQGSVVKVRECSQSISRIKLPLKGHYFKKFSTQP